MDLSGLFETAQTLMESAQASPWAIVPVIGIYVGLSFLAAPQFGLHAMTALVFGPALGLIYAWVATLLGAALHFALGKRFGNRLLERYGGERSNRISRKLARHGILAAAIIRLVPSGPFIVVNVAAGTSHMAFWRFFLGTAMGTLPKILAIALVGGSIMDLIATQDPVWLGMIAAGLALWIVLGWMVRHRFLSARADIATDVASVEAELSTLDKR